MTPRNYSASCNESNVNDWICERNFNLCAHVCFLSVLDNRKHVTSGLSSRTVTFPEATVVNTDTLRTRTAARSGSAWKHYVDCKKIHVVAFAVLQ